MKKPRLKTLIVLAVVALAAAGGYYAWQRSRAEPDPAKRYQTEAVEPGDIRQTVSANGTLNPVTLVNVGTQVSGTVKGLYVDFNDHVEKGQVLMELDDSVLRAQLSQSTANLRSNESALALARTNADRLRQLFRQDYVSRQEVDQAVQSLRAAEAAVVVSRAQVQRDTTNLGYAVIRSPVSGTVISREVDLGQTVAASFQTPTLFKIAQDLRKMQIDSSFAEADVGQIRTGQAATFRVDAFPDRSFAGRVRQVRLNPTTQQNVVTYNVVVSVDNPEQLLLPGMTAYVNVLVAERDDVLRVPNTALRFRPTDETADGKEAGRQGGSRESRSAGSREAGGPAAGGPAAGGPAAGAAGRGGQRARGRGQGPKPAVYVLRGGRLQKVPLETGISDGRYTEVLGGALKAGDRVVTDDLSSDKPKSGARGAAQPAGGPGGGNFRMRMF